MKPAPLSHDRVFAKEEFAQTYSRQHRKMAENFGHEVARRLLARGFQPGRIIDIGCGFGATNMVLAKYFPDSELVGVDLSDPLLSLARQTAQAENFGERLRFEKADVQRLPFEDRCFDAVLNLNMVYLVENPVAMLDEIERVLAPGGYAFIADLRRSWLGLLEREIQAGLTVREAVELFGRSKLRPDIFSAGVIWWRFETKVQ